MSSLKIADKIEDFILKGKCNPSDFDLCVKEVSDFLNQEPQKKDDVLKELESKEKKYDKLQLANKVLMNALYGYFGATSSRFYREDIAEGITSVGQEESLRVQRLLEKEGYEILYGDSVVGSSRIYVKLGKENKSWTCLPIERFFELHKGLAYKKRGKEIVTFRNVSLDFYTPSVDLETGKLKVSRILRVIRHKVDKALYRVSVLAGPSVVVTEDHSCIVYRDGKLIEVPPKKVRPGRDALLFLRFSSFGPEGYTLETVRSVEKVGKTGDYVYDLEVEGTHTFFADDLLVHNTDSMFILVKGMPEEIKDDIEEAKKWIREKFVPRINELAQKELETMARELGVKNPILDKTYHFKFKQEMIARSGIFLPSISRGDEAKKRYDLWVIDEEGVPKDKFAHAGTPLKQSKLPKVVREKFKEFLVLLLKEMKTDPEELLRPARELREIILKACEEWDLEKIGSNFQFSKPFEEYKSGKAPEFAIEWNLVCEKLDLPPYQVGGKYKFVEVKPKKDIDWSVLSEFNLTDEKKEIIKSLHSFAKRRNITSVAIVLEDDRYYLSILKAIFNLDTDRILVKYVENIFKAHLSVLNIPIEKIAFDYGEVDDLL